MGVGACLAAGVLIFAGASSVAAFVIALGLLGFMLMGPDSLLSGTAAVDTGDQRTAMMAAGVINGVGHYSGYRNFQTDDASTNIVPWGILIGGEELHNNHHAYASSARLSNKWFEFDIGWLYIRVMEMLGLAQVRKLAPRIRFESGKAKCDLETLQAVITHRYDVVARFARTLTTTWKDELRALRLRGVSIDLSTFKHWLQRDSKDLLADERAHLEEVLTKSKVLATSYSMRQELSALWARSTASKEQLLHQLEDWCHRAELSGIVPLQQFSRTLRGYA
jgi:stearoyl-CoA desaturase (delta-9 desaturase)